jgi:hypothetical protein
VRSDRFGPIGLGFVTRALAEAGTPLTAAGCPARVAAVPFGPVSEDSLDPPEGAA